MLPTIFASAEFYALSAFVNLMTSLGIGFFIYTQNRHSTLNRAFFYFTMCAAAWSIGYIFWQLSTNAGQALFFARVLMVGAIFSAPAYLHFVLALLEEDEKKKVLIRSLYAISFFFAIIDFLPPLAPFFVSHVEPMLFFPFWPKPGFLYSVYLLWWMACLLYAAYRLIRRLVSASDVLFKRQIQFVLGAMLVAFISGSMNYLPWYNIAIPPFLNICVSLYVIIIGYAVLRHHLFDAKIISTELLTFTLWIILLFRTFFSENLQEQVINFTLFALVVVFGIFLIRSVIREVEQREEIEKLSEEKSEFMTFASHEIRNPITAMRGFASLIADGTVGEVSEKVQDVAYKILVNGDLVLSLISEFLNKSKLELGQIAYQIGDVDIGKTITSIAEGFRPHAQQKGLTLDLRIDYPQLMARADEAKLREVVGNLIDNSVKYTKTGGITIIVEKRNGMARIVTSDTGVGIESATMPQLFKKFSRADAKKMNLFGTGLGLYLAKTFIEGMGGKIWAESEGKDKGSRFIIELHTV